MPCAQLRLLCANDVYKPDRFALLKTMKLQYAGRGVTKCILPGDFIGGSLFACKHAGESMVKVANAVGFDYVTLGNHEFDFGEDRLEELMDMSSFPWLGSNIRYTRDGALFHTVLDVDVFEVPLGDGSDNSSPPVRIGVFGVCTQATPNLAGCTGKAKFESVISHAKRCTEHLRNDLKCEVVLALTHVALANDKDIAESVPGIDVILGGHDHDPFLLIHHGTLIAKCGQNLDYIGIVDLDIVVTPADSGGSRHVKLNHSFQLLCTDSLCIEPDVAVLDIIQRFESELCGSAGEADDEVIVTVQPTERSAGGDSYTSGENLAVALSTQTCDVRTHETAFACHVADAMKWVFCQLGFPCDFAIINGGFVRGDRLYPPGSPILHSHMMQEMPFPRCPVLLRMTGAEVQLGLEQMLVGAHAPVGSFPHLSAGLTAVYDIKEEPLRRIKAIAYQGQCSSNGLSDDGSMFDLSREYMVAVSDFYCMKEGDGVDAFTNREVVARCDDVIGTVVSDYFRTLKFISGTPPGRFISAPRRI